MKIQKFKRNSVDISFCHVCIVMKRKKNPPDRTSIRTDTRNQVFHLFFFLPCCWALNFWSHGFFLLSWVRPQQMKFNFLLHKLSTNACTFVRKILRLSLTLFFLLQCGSKKVWAMSLQEPIRAFKQLNQWMQISKWYHRNSVHKLLYAFGVKWILNGLP